MRRACFQRQSRLSSPVGIIKLLSSKPRHSIDTTKTGSSLTTKRFTTTWKRNNVDRASGVYFLAKKVSACWIAKKALRDLTILMLMIRKLFTKLSGKIRKVNHTYSSTFIEDRIVRIANKTSLMINRVPQSYRNWNKKCIKIREGIFWLKCSTIKKSYNRFISSAWQKEIKQTINVSKS